jgi:ribonuclease HII
MPRVFARCTIENSVRRFGFKKVAGVDEVGRGCLAGPVLVAAVILDPDQRISGLRDSKLLTPRERARLFDQIAVRSIAWSLAVASPVDVDRLNVHRASLQAMFQAVTKLVPLPDFVLADGFLIPDLFIPQRKVIKGDLKCSAIAAASILAKVIRDRYMQKLHKLYPRYGFDRHKGYATGSHLEAIARFGYSSVHRYSFRPATLFNASAG